MSEVRVTALGDARFLVTQGGRQQLAHGVTTRDGHWIFMDGHVWWIGARTTARPRTAPASVEAGLASPMPATVIAITCEPGQTVSRGDVLIRLEAMKMELQIMAPRDGVVATIGCRRGELVQPGVPLLELS